MDVLVALGPHTFYAVHPSFEKFKNEIAFDWRSQRRIGRRPGQQFVGPGDEESGFDGILYPEMFGSGPELIDGLRASGMQGEQLPLIEIASGSLIGSVQGTFVITHIGQARQHYGRAGPKKIEFNLKLKAYGEDGGGFGGGLF